MSGEVTHMSALRHFPVTNRWKVVPHHVAFLFFHSEFDEEVSTVTWQLNEKHQGRLLAQGLDRSTENIWKRYSRARCIYIIDVSVVQHWSTHPYLGSSQYTSHNYTRYVLCFKTFNAEMFCITALISTTCFCSSKKYHSSPSKSTENAAFASLN